MDGQQLKIAAAGCFALVILSTALSSRFDIAGSFANVFTTLGGVQTSEKTEVVAVPSSNEWRSSLEKYATIDPAIASSTSGIASTSPELSMTDTFAQAMFGTYLLNRDQLDSTDARVAFVSDFATAFKNSLKPVIHTKEELTVRTSVSSEEYIYGISEIIRQSSGTTDHELTIFERLLTEETARKEDIASLQKIAAVYEHIENDLLAVPVSQDFANTHLTFINAVTSVRAHILDMSLIEKDPIRAAAGMQAYLVAVENMRAAIAVIQMKIHVQGITFPKSSLAALFMQL